MGKSALKAWVNFSAASVMPVLSAPDLGLYHHILSECFEALTIALHDRDSQMACLAGIDVTHDARLSFMRSIDDRTAISVFKFILCFDCHIPSS
jgi:hypothetical protein